jgi:hypothetical protein
MGSCSTALSACAELLRLARWLPMVELWRRRSSLHRAVAVARRLGARQPAREPEDRKRLRGLIGAADRRLPGGGNCVRRALLEITLDGGAAREPFYAGLRIGGGVGSGHAWLESQSTTESFDAIIKI